MSSKLDEANKLIDLLEQKTEQEASGHVLIDPNEFKKAFKDIASLNIASNE